MRCAVSSLACRRRSRCTTSVFISIGSWDEKLLSLLTSLDGDDGEKERKGEKKGEKATY